MYNQVVNLEINTKRNNLIIHGLPEPKEECEDLTTLVTSTLKEIGVEIQTGEIDRFQRLGKIDVNSQKIRPILLATTTLQKKIQIVRNKNKLKQNTYITQDL